MMRILHICQRDDPDTGGALRVAEALVREQLAAGMQSWILFLYGPPAHLAEIFHPHSICLGLDSSRQALQGLVALRNTLARIEPDLVHSHDGILWPRLAWLHRKTPVVTHAHAPPGCRVGIKERLGWPLTKITTDCLIGISQHTIHAWIESGYRSGNCHMIPNGVDFNRFYPADEEDRKALRKKLGLPVARRILVWVGRLHNETKGTDRLVEVAAMLPDDVTLVIIGQGPEHHNLCTRCNSSINDGRMVMIGSTTHPEDFYRAADLFLFTSYQEAFGLVILEAVASGLPILSFPVSGGGGAVELLKEFNAYELEDGIQATAMGCAIARSLEKRPSALALREKAMETHSWPALSEEIVGVYRSVLEDWNKGR